MTHNTTSVGRSAEDAAAVFLEQKGCTIVARNWRTRWCEIDVIAERDGIIYFCEVKYRRTTRQGDGLEYVTAAKLRQMQFAAGLWTARYDWRGECQLCAIAVAGPQFAVVSVVKDLAAV